MYLSKYDGLLKISEWACTQSRWNRTWYKLEDRKDFGRTFLKRSSSILSFDVEETKEALREEMGRAEVWVAECSVIDLGPERLLELLWVERKERHIWIVGKASHRGQKGKEWLTTTGLIFNLHNLRRKSKAMSFWWNFHNYMGCQEPLGCDNTMAWACWSPHDLTSLNGEEPAQRSACRIHCVPSGGWISAQLRVYILHKLLDLCFMQTRDVDAAPITHKLPHTVTNSNFDNYGKMLIF